MTICEVPGCTNTVPWGSSCDAKIFGLPNLKLCRDCADKYNRIYKLEHSTFRRILLNKIKKIVT